MTSQPVHDRLDRQPTWMVQGVFDPDVSGQNFSYTIGLHDRGLPELHLWASPPEGDDPGDGWAFSMRDQCRILNELAFGLVDGTLAVGSTVVEEYDDGLATVTFRIDPPGDREALEAYGTAPDAVVLPVSWSLRRPPIGELSPMTPEAERTMCEEWGAALRTLPRTGGRPPGWQFPMLSFDPEQEFGPRTTMVLARAAQLWSCGDLGSLLRVVFPIAVDRLLDWQPAVARALARSSGRQRALTQVESRVPSLVDAVIDRSEARWSQALHRLAPDLDRMCVTEREAVRANARDWLLDATRAVMSVEVVADIADQRLLLAARGPWLAALNPRATLPGREWVAGPAVIRAVRRLLRPLDLTAWSQIYAAHDRARRDVDSTYNDLCWDLTPVFQTAATGCPWAKLSDLPAARELRQIVGRGRPWENFVEWASCLSTLLSQRAHHTAAEVATFVEPVRGLLPQLEAELNKPR